MQECFCLQWCRRWWQRWGPRRRLCSCVWQRAHPGYRRSEAPACERQSGQQHNLHAAWCKTTQVLLLCINVLDLQKNVTQAMSCGSGLWFHGCHMNEMSNCAVDFLNVKSYGGPFMLLNNRMMHLSLYVLAIIQLNQWVTRSSNPLH